MDSSTLFQFAALLAIFSCSCKSFFPNQKEINAVCRGQRIQRLPLSNSCKHFVQCTYDIGRVLECGIEESCFREDQNRCVKTTECLCKEPQYDKTFVRNYCQKFENSWDLKLPAEVCSSFYMCLGPFLDPVLIDCPHGFHYSRVEGMCRSPIEAGCQPIMNICGNVSVTNKIPASRCSEYYECSEQSKEGIILKKCSPGFYYEHSVGECSRDTHSKCKESEGSTESNTNCVNGRDDTVFEHKECNRFYVCSEGVLKERTCLKGQYFNSKRKMCVEDVENKCIVKIEN